MQWVRGLWLVEVVEPGTTTPVAPGQRGEFLFTSLMDHSLAFLRWRSEDMGYVRTELAVPVDLEFVPAEDLLALGPPHKIPRLHEAVV